MPVSDYSETFEPDDAMLKLIEALAKQIVARLGADRSQSGGG